MPERFAFKKYSLRTALTIVFEQNPSSVFFEYSQVLFNQSLCFVNASDFEIIEQYIRTVSCVMTEYPFRLGFLAIKFILFFLKGDLFFHTLRKILFLY